jgi:predicted metal-dependent hydrolase
MTNPRIYEQLLAVANSALSITIFSTFISAFAGTWGAQVLAGRTARRKELLHEIRGVNAALGFAFNICNSYIGAKKQHIREIVAKYQKQCADREAHHVGLKEGTIPAGTPFLYNIELQTILPPFSPIEGLQKVLMDRITPDGRALILLTPLIQSIESFSDIVAQRNAWIAEVKNMPENTDPQKTGLYFGTPYAVGRIDDRYPSLMKALELHTDDCIAFSVLLVGSLRKYGEKLVSQYGRGAPKIGTPNFETAGDLIPDMKQYSAWSNN